MAWEAVVGLHQLEPREMMLAVVGTDQGPRNVCVARLDDHDVVAVHDTTHGLHEGDLLDDDVVECLSRDCRFDLRTGRAAGLQARGMIPVYACKIERDAIWVDADRPLNDAPVPRGS